MDLALFLRELRRRGPGYDLRAMSDEHLETCERACRASSDVSSHLQGVRDDLAAERFRRWGWRAVQAACELGAMSEEDARAWLGARRNEMRDGFRAGIPPAAAVEAMMPTPESED